MVHMRLPKAILVKLAKDASNAGRTRPKQVAWILGKHLSGDGEK